MLTSLIASWILLLVGLMISVASEPVIYTDITGDSLSVAYNAVRNGLPSTSSGESGVLNCPNGGITGRSWGSELNSNQCPPPSSNLVNSFSQYQNCDGSLDVNMTVLNSAASGATMLSNFNSQCVTISNNLQTKSPLGRRQVLIFMGHNDICGGVVNKTNGNCSNTDLDPANYCRTATGAFEREFRNGLDKLIVNDNTTVSVLGPGRVSQLCRVKDLQMCQLALYFPNSNSCNNAWRSFLLGSGICASLTNDCSNTRIEDAYNFEKLYRDIMVEVSAEYDSIPAGDPSKPFTYNGKTVGGAIKGHGVNFVYSDAIWVTQLSPPDVSCCDCFHASIRGQQKLADAAFYGATCTPTTPCCTDTGSALENGQCTTNVITDGRWIPGVQLR